ncbi:MAG: hypothetical protein JF632_03325 [Acidobacteria bacterium]|nr:hypothetical protein [Acidobacteriota bacterium]
MKNVWIACGLVVLAVPLAAQTRSLERARDVNGQDSVRLYQKMVGEVRARIAVEAKITTGAPYSAEAVTEANQLQELDPSGVVVSVSIVDPVAHFSYVLDPASRSAYRDPIQMAMPMTVGRGRGPGMMRRSPDGVPGDVQERAKLTAEEAARMREVLPPPPPPPPMPGMPGFKTALDEAVLDSAAHEDLGKQNIEGVAASGVRSTTTIPAGDIGNLQPIKVVSEQWFSPDLQVLVMTRHTDPRSGETIYKLQNIVRAEPDRSLFTVPADYTLRESGIREPLMR